MSLRTRLLAAAALLVASLGVSGFLIIRTVERSELHQLDNQLATNVPIAVGIARDAVPTDFSPPVSRRPSLSDSYLAVINNGTRTVLASPQAANGQQPRTPDTEATSITSAHPNTVASQHGSARWRALLFQAPTGGQVLIAVYMGPVDATTAQLRTAILVVGGVIALILLTAGFWIERLGLRPVVGMKHVAEAIIAGDRNRRVSARSTAAETAELGNAFNSMLDQQHAIEARLRQFVADASHELRTPTAAISGLAQLWRQGELRDGPGLQDAMRRIGQESARMKGLVEELLLLARLDEGMPLHHEPVDLTRVIQDLLRSAAATHPSRRIESQLEPGVTVPGDSQALHRLAANLISNALSHTPPNSAITVRLWEATTEAVLVVSDAGPGMHPSEAAHAFDRFWRAEASRTRTGSGLGLSIVQAIVTAHGGHVQLDTSPGTGTRVTVGLPRQPPNQRSDPNRKPRTQAEGGEPDLASVAGGRRDR